MPFKKTALYTALSLAAAALTAVSCIENDRTLGQGLVPPEYNLILGTKTFDLPVTNRVSDSIQASNSSNMLVGTLSDPLFGTVKVNSASFILPYSDSTDFGDSPRLRSAYINLAIDSTYYLEDNQQGIHQRIRIYKLTTPIDSTKRFCNSITGADYDPVPVTVSDPVIYGSGTVRIDLTDEFAMELLSTTPEEFKDLNLFLDRIHGLYLEVEDPINTESGGRLNYLSLGYSTINIEYTLNDPDRGFVDHDTTESFVFGYTTALNNCTTTSEHLVDSTPGDSLFLEGLSGVKPHISAADLKQMLNNWLREEGLGTTPIFLSRAELTFPYEMPEDYSRFDTEHPAAIYAFTSTPWATDTMRYYKPLPEIYNSVNTGKINRSVREYSLDITTYLQDLLQTDSSYIDPSMDLWIAPIAERTSSYSSTVYYEFDNHNYNKIILNGPLSERHPTLTITYGLMGE